MTLPRNPWGIVSAKRASSVSFQRAGVLPPLLFIDLQEESSPQENSRFEHRVTPRLTRSRVTAPELQKPEEHISISLAIPNFFLTRLFKRQLQFLRCPVGKRCTGCVG